MSYLIKRISLLISLLMLVKLSYAQNPEFSTAGFFEVKDSGRTVYSMNPAWLFYKGKPAKGDPSKVNFNDKSWDVVSLPNGIEYLTQNASGCVNYQGVVWYRKHFKLDKNLSNKKLFLHFEAIMGKSKVFINGELVKEHFGGYLPIIIDATDKLKAGKDNVIAMWADNSDDPNYPPGKQQDMLDYAYLGGIYRDCWLVANNDVYLTNANYENDEAAGGFFFANKLVSDNASKSDILLKIRNDKSTTFIGKVHVSLKNKEGQEVASFSKNLEIAPKGSTNVKEEINLSNPHLWAPWDPYLYNVYVSILDKKGSIIDGYRQRVGIRSIEFKGKDGFFFNGKPYPNPLIGANRHQDFAIVGNAVANSAHWRDAKKLKDLGLEVIRNAHCPQDPAFMDACDELGLFVIVNTPGWQFWNEKPIFEQRVFDDIKNMVRRDRNHACVWLWEPILNETWYPKKFALDAKNLVSKEFPYPYVYSACDDQAKGAEYYNVQFCHPKQDSLRNDSITYFTREWGDNVDDWSSHNSPSRVSRVWGEVPMLTQANHYAKPYYPYTCYDKLFKEFYRSRQHIGGALWHSFDHQRGYHPDPFYGGLMDIFRQPKYSYYMFKAQRPVKINPNLKSETGPMLFIANDMDPFSPRDVSVFTNCDEVRIQYTPDGEIRTMRKNKDLKGMPSPIMVFKDLWDFQKDKAITRQKRSDDVYIKAEGIVNNQVVITKKIYPSRRAEQIRLRIDNENMNLVADGSDFVVVIAEMTDRNGNVKRLNNDYIKFSISGEGRIIGDESIIANPKPIQWGSAPIIVQSTTNPGKIHITASVLYPGSQKAISGELEITTIPSIHSIIYDKKIASKHTLTLPMGNKNDAKVSISEEKLRQKENTKKLKVVETQQTDFGEKNH